MCQVCDNPLRADIDRAIFAQDSLRDIATRFKTSKDAVHRHKTRCLKRTLPALTTPLPVPAYQTPGEVAIVQQNVRSVAQRAGQLVDKMEELAQRFEATGDTNGIMRAAKEIREGLRLMAQLSGELSPNQVNVAVMAPSYTASAEWPILVRVLSRYPQIHAELSRELQEAGL